jgi:hypothetical protein
VIDPLGSVAVGVAALAVARTYWLRRSGPLPDNSRTTAATTAPVQARLHELEVCAGVSCRDDGGTATRQGCSRRRNTVAAAL